MAHSPGGAGGEHAQPLCPAPRAVAEPDAVGSGDEAEAAATAQPVSDTREGDGAEPPQQQASKRRRCYRYGNYRGYYGYRVGTQMEDHRLLTLRPEWFSGRRCLDVGCNEGLVSLTLAVKYRTASFEGVDIDASLVHSAQGKLRALQRAAAEAAAQVAATAPGEAVPEERASLAAAASALASTRYRRGNFLDVDVPPASVDTIVCLSVSKWVHLNWGDAGLLRLFDRCHEVLAPGGLLILEPQPWKSYRQVFKKQRMPAEVQEQFRSIQLRPDDFAASLQQRTGFVSVEELREGGRRGFDRPLLLCRKADATSAAQHNHHE